MVITVVRREMLDTPMGRIQTVVIKPETKFHGVMEKKGDSYIWLTDDDRHFLVRMEAKVRNRDRRRDVSRKWSPWVTRREHSRQVAELDRQIKFSHILFFIFSREYTSGQNRRSPFALDSSGSSLNILWIESSRFPKYGRRASGANSRHWKSSRPSSRASGPMSWELRFRILFHRPGSNIAREFAAESGYSTDGRRFLLNQPMAFIPRNRASRRSVCEASS